MGPLVEKWLRSASPPGTIYELLGRPLLDPDLPALLAAVRALNRALWPYQNHSDHETARRALDLLAELGRAGVILGDPGRRLAYDREVLARLAAEYAAAAGHDDDWHAPRILEWLAVEKDVHGDRLGEALGAVIATAPDEPPLVEKEADEDLAAREAPRPAHTWPWRMRPRALAGIGLATLALAFAATSLVAVRLTQAGRERRPPPLAQPTQPASVADTPPSALPPSAPPPSAAAKVDVAGPGPGAGSNSGGGTGPGADPEALLASAEAAIRDDLPSQARRTLARYLDQPGIHQVERARRLLDQLELTFNASAARDLLRSLSEEELAEFARSGTLALLDRVESPALRSRIRNALARELLHVLRERAGLSVRDGSRLPVPEPPVPRSTPRAQKIAGQERAAEAAPAEVEAPLERALEAPEDYEGKSIVPAGYYLVSTRPAPVGEGMFTLGVKTRDGWTVVAPARDEPGRPRLLLDAEVAGSLTRWLAQRRIHPDGVAESKCIPTVAVRGRADGSGRDVVIVGLEYLYHVDDRGLLQHHTGSVFESLQVGPPSVGPLISRNRSRGVFESLQVGPSSASTTFEDRRGWLARLGGEAYVEAIRHHLKHTGRK